MPRYEAFDLDAVAGRATNYITRMVDETHDYLPYWFIQINEAPAYARHVRVDDAELVASWYEAATALNNVVGGDEKLEAVRAGFRRHIMKSWGEDGLRYHEDYPWSNTNHCAFHEMAYILSALNRILAEFPDDTEAERRAHGLVRAMRKLVHERSISTFWSGDYPFPEKCYEFPGDVYLRDGGFVSERVTGRGEESIRNGMMLHALVVRAERHNDEVALDLAEGMANFLLGLSRYFNWKGEFFGHVHSAVWVASGLARLGRLMDNERYIRKAREIHSYVRSISGSFGWVPEYAQWFHPSEMICETCCIKDMIECGFELIECGDDLWEMIDSYARNQLTENQIKDGCFICADNSKEDDHEHGYTWKQLDERAVGGWSGGTEPNCISLQRFRSIAGCCIGTAPQALELVWQRIIDDIDGGIRVNFAMARDDERATVSMGYPNEGFVKVVAKRAGHVAIRLYSWMGDNVACYRDGAPVPVTIHEGCAWFADVPAGGTVEIRHAITPRTTVETLLCVNYEVTWQGPDVVKMMPPGLPVRLYQREEGVAKEYPDPPGRGAKAQVSMKPTNQKG